MNDKIDVSNDIFVSEFEIISNLPGLQRTSKIFETNIIPEIKSLTPSDITKELANKIRNNGYDPYFIDDLHLKIPSKSIFGQQPINVAMNQGIVIGLSDFRHHIEDTQSFRNSFDLLLAWNRLRLHCKITVDQNGLQNSGDLEMDITRLYMIVHLKKLDTGIPKIEMSKIGDLKVKLHGFDDLSDDLKSSISKEAKHKIRNIFNDKIRNILLMYMKDILYEYADENMLSSLIH